MLTASYILVLGLPVPASLLRIKASLRMTYDSPLRGDSSVI